MLHRTVGFISQTVRCQGQEIPTEKCSLEIAQSHIMSANGAPKREVWGGGSKFFVQLGPSSTQK